MPGKLTKAEKEMTQRALALDPEAVRIETARYSGGVVMRQRCLDICLRFPDNLMAKHIAVEIAKL